MKKMYKTALGKSVDMDQLRLSNEETIAVGNMKVNARGDELGPGGQIVRTRNEIMNDYYQLNTPTVGTSAPPVVDEQVIYQEAAPQVATPGVLRGGLAASIANEETEE